MRSSRQGLLTLALAGACLAAVGGSAHASTVESVTPATCGVWNSPPPPCTEFRLTGGDGPDDVTIVTHLLPRVVAVTDRAGLTAKGACNSLGATAALCAYDLHEGGAPVREFLEDPSGRWPSFASGFRITPFTLGGGADRFSSPLGGFWVDGGPGNDVLSGDGNVFYGHDGDDVLSGGSDYDQFNGEAGADVLDGGPQVDALYGGSGPDHVIGGAGEDRIDGGAGDDLIDARDGEVDFVWCGDGIDRVVADTLDRLDGCETVELP